MFGLSIPPTPYETIAAMGGDPVSMKQLVLQRLGLDYLTHGPGRNVNNRARPSHPVMKALRNFSAIIEELRGEEMMLYTVPDALKDHIKELLGTTPAILDIFTFIDDATAALHIHACRLAQKEHAQKALEQGLPDTLTAAEKEQVKRWASFNERAALSETVNTLTRAPSRARS